MTRVSHFRLGLFIVVCAAVGAVAIVWVGAARVFESFRTYAAYFGEPVTGLEPGAAVNHLGVRIGNVESIELAPGDRLVQVRVKLRSSFRLDPSMALGVSQAGITGAPLLALDETPPEQRRDLPHPATRDPVLPTRAGGGGLGGAMQGLEQVMADARAASAGVRRIAGAGPRGEPSQLEQLVRDLQGTTQSLRTATASIARQVEGIRPGAAAGIADRVERTAELGEKTARSLDEHVDASLVLLRENLAQLKQAVVEAQSLARSLRAEPGRILERGGGGDPFSR